MADSMEYKFVNPVPTELEINCPICFDIVKDPQLTQCCGHHFCLSCIQPILKDNKPCPLCKEPRVKAVLNKSLKRVIGGLKVYCPYKFSGCSWEGEIRDLDAHLKKDSREGDCKYVTIACSNGCGENIERHLLKQHEETTCQSRASFDNPKLLKMLSDKINRLTESNETYSKEIAQLKQITSSCQTEIANLKQKIQLLTAKLDQQTLYNGAEPNTSTGSIPHHVSTSVTPLSLRIVPYEFVFSNYQRYCEKPELWFCPSFYTHSQGYKMCTRVAPQGVGNGERTHVSVHFYLMRGEYDDKLSWPFRGSVTIELVNQLENRNHFEQTSDFNERTPIQYCRR